MMKTCCVILLCALTAHCQIRPGVVAEEEIPRAVIPGSMFAFTFAEQTGFLSSNTSNPSTSANTLSPTIRVWNQNAIWFRSSAGSSTLTDNFSAGPNNSNLTASRWQCGGSSCALAFPANGTYVLPVGQTTFSAFLMLNTGTSATVTPQYLGSGVTTSWNVTNAWQRFTFTNNNGVATSGIQIFTPANSDVLVYGLQAESAASASPYVAPTFNLFLSNGLGSSTFAPTWTGNGTLTFTNSQRALAVNDTDTTIATGTYYVAIKSTGTTPQQYGWAGLVPNANGQGVPQRFELQTSYFNSNSLPDGGSQSNWPFIGGLGLTKIFPSANLYDQAWHICAVTADGADLHLYVDGILADSPVASPVSGSPTPVPANVFLLGDASTSGLGFPGSVAYASMYANVIHSYSQIKQNTNAIANAMRGNGLTPVRGVQNGILTFEGDSITDGIGSGNVGHAFRVAAHYSRAWINYGHSGDQVAQLNARAAQLDALIDRSKQFNILVVDIGRNDLDHVDAPTFEASLQAYWQARIAAGWTVIAVTLLPTTDTTAQALIPTVNAWINANAVMLGCAAVADVGNDPTILANYTSTAYLYDGTHPTSLTYSIMTPYMTNAIDSLHLGV